MSVEEDDVTVLDRGEYPAIVGAAADPAQMVTAGTINLTDAENNPQLEAEEPARLAEKAHRKYESFGKQFAKLDRQQLDAALEAGLHLLKAKEIVGHGNFKKEQERWRTNGTITFSDRSCRRYMLLATYAKEIKMATVATLREAEKLASALKEAADSQKATGRQKAGQAAAPSPTSSSAPANSAFDLETQVLKTMRHFTEVDDQRAFLTSLIEKLNHRLQLLAS